MKQTPEIIQHTPGPWMIFPGGDIGSAAIRTPDHTVIRSGTVKGATIGEAMANARLIAAAPRLNTACMEVKSTARVIYEDNDPKQDCMGVMITHEAYMLCLDALAQVAGGAL